MEQGKLWDNFDLAVVNAGMDIKSVANKAGVSYNSIITWKHRGSMPRVDEAKKLAEAVGLSMDELFYGESQSVVNEGYETNLLNNIRDKAPDLFAYLIATFGYSDTLAGGKTKIS